MDLFLSSYLCGNLIDNSLLLIKRYIWNWELPKDVRENIRVVPKPFLENLNKILKISSSKI